MSFWERELQQKKFNKSMVNQLQKKYFARIKSNQSKQRLKPKEEACSSEMKKYQKRYSRNKGRIIDRAKITKISKLLKQTVLQINTRLI